MRIFEPHHHRDALRPRDEGELHRRGLAGHRHRRDLHAVHAGHVQLSVGIGQADREGHAPDRLIRHGSVDVEEVDPGGRDLRATFTADVRLSSGEPWRTRLIQVFRFDDQGLVREIVVEAEDQEEFDRRMREWDSWGPP